MPPASLAMHYALFHSIYLFITVSFKIKMNLKLALASSSLISQQTWESTEVVRREASLSRRDSSQQDGFCSCFVPDSPGHRMRKRYGINKTFLTAPSLTPSSLPYGWSFLFIFQKLWFIKIWANLGSRYFSMEHHHHLTSTETLVRVMVMLCDTMFPLWGDAIRTEKWHFVPLQDVETASLRINSAWRLKRNCPTAASNSLDTPNLCHWIL